MKNENRPLVCAECGCVIADPDDARRNPDGEIICNNCFEDQYCYCGNCGNVIRFDEAVWIEDEEMYICEDCAEREYYQCQDCGNWYSHRGITYRDDSTSEYICDNCSYRWTQCDDCGRIVRDYDILEGDDGWYCEDCIDEHSNKNIHDYGYKPDPVFFGCKPGGQARTYGLELEIDNGDDADECAGDILAAAPNGEVYCKHDGSLNDGVEIVTHPCTLGYHMAQFPWADILNAAREHGFRSHDTTTCGLHIHVGRDALPDDAPEKIILLFDSLWRQLVTFSRRKDVQLNQWAAKPDADISGDDAPRVAKDKADKARGHGRYQAVNLQNYKTIEFRLFRGTLKRSTIIASVQLIDTLLSYCDTHTLPEIAAASWQTVVKSDYAELNTYLAQKGLL